jgi:hypothetical protein
MDPRRRSQRLQFVAREYMEHLRALADVNEELNALKMELLATMHGAEGVEVDVNTVLVVVDKPAERKPVTQKLMREAGVSEEVLGRILAATAPSGKRVKKLKTMLLDVFLAAQDRKRDATAAGSRSHVEDEGISDEEAR